MKKIGVAIVGCGSIAHFRHAPEYSANPDCDLLACFDSDRARAERLAKKFGAQVFASLEAILADPDIDAVSICTANSTHAELTMRALEAGKHVLCEKPMATCLSDCLAMRDCARRCDKVLMIGHNQRFAPAHVLAKKLLKRGDMGRVISFRTTFGHKGPEFWSIDKSVNTWFFRKDSAIMGATADLGIHKLDLIMWLLDDQVEEISAFCGTLDKKDAQGRPIPLDDNMLSLLKMKRGALGTLTASWTHYGEEDNSTVLYCEKGIMKIYDNPVFPLDIVMRDGTRIHHELGAIQTNDDLEQVNSRVIDSFIAAIVEGKEPAVSLDESIEAMRAIFACLDSSSEGKHCSLQ